MMVSGTSLSIERQQPCAPGPPVALALERGRHVAKRAEERSGAGGGAGVLVLVSMLVDISAAR